MRHEGHMRRFGPIIAILLVVATMPGWASAQDDWPKRQAVKIVVPFPPGGTTDILARVMAERIAEPLGQQIVIENKAGAGANIGAEQVARAAPDGYTLMMGTIGPLAINRAVYKNLAYDHMKDFEPISLVAEVANIMVVHPSIAANSAREFAAFAKSQPGKMNYGSPGHGSSAHLSMELFKLRMGVDLAHVTYRGSAPLATDLMAGQVQVTIDNLPAYIGHVRAGRLKALAVSTVKRWPATPDLPTLIEATGHPDLTTTAWFAMVAPARTPGVVIERVARLIRERMTTPEVRAKLSEQGAEIVAGTPAELGEYMRVETEKWAKVVAAANIKVD